MLGVFCWAEIGRLSKLTFPVLLHLHILLEEVRQRLGIDAVNKIFSEVLPDIALKAEAGLRSEVFPLFFSSTLFRTIDDDDSDFLTSADLEVRYYHDAVSKIGLAARLEGFKRAGVDTFDVKQVLTFYFEEYTYKVGSSKDDTWLRKLNHQNISQDELSLIVQTWTGLIVEKINDKLSQICFS